MSKGTQAKGALDKIIVFKLVKTKDPASMADEDLLFAHSMTHAFYRNVERGIAIKGWKKADLVTYHEKIIKEMVAREFLIRLTPNELDNSVAYLFPEVTKVPAAEPEKSLGVDDAGAAMTKPSGATLVRATLVCPKCQKSISPPMKACPSCGTSLVTGTHSKMIKAFEYLNVYEIDSVLAALAIAEEAGLLKSFEIDKDHHEIHDKLDYDISKEMTLKDYEYLLHHIAIDDAGKEEVHHCMLYDHIANMFMQSHLLIKDGEALLDGRKVSDGLFHVISELESTQEVAWSNEEAKSKGLEAKEMKAGMTLEQKAKEW